MTSTSMEAHVPDEVRVGILGALARGMSMSYAARADGVSIAQAALVASEAGYPDMGAVHDAWTSLRDQLGQHTRMAPPPRKPAPPSPRPPLPDLRPAAPGPEDPEPVGLQPCEVCSLPVSAAYIEKTGRARHGNHKED